jgi:hypothetical protein
MSILNRNINIFNMATPLIRFKHPDLPNEDQYFIHNTFYILPILTNGFIKFFYGTMKII